MRDQGRDELRGNTVSVTRVLEPWHKTARSRRRAWRYRVVVLPALGTLLVSVLLIIPSAGSAFAQVQGGNSYGVESSRQANQATAPLLSASVFASNVGSIYSRLASLGVEESSFPSPEKITSSTYDSYVQLTSESTFSSALETFGASSFILSFSFSDAGITQAYFGFNWFTPTQASTTYWSLNEATGLLSGPITQSATVAFHNFDYSINWAGWEYWPSGTPSLGANQGDELVPTISVPPQSPANVPSGIYVHAVATAWLSLAASQGGSNGLLQTGFSVDASQPSWSDYNMWYEYYLSSSSSPCPSYNFPGNPTTAPGDYMWESINVQNNGSWFILDVNEGNSHVGGSVYVQSGYCGMTSSWRPYYAEYIVEAYTYDENGQGVIQQIAKLSSQVAFYDQEWCTYSFSTCYTTSSSGLNSNIYQLAQSQTTIFGYGSCGWFCNWDDNTNQVYNSGCGGFFGTCGYPTVSWVTSDFNYNVAH